MFTDEYNKRLVELFKGGAATKAQWAELVEAVGCALDKDAEKLHAIHAGIGYPELVTA